VTDCTDHPDLRNSCVPQSPAQVGIDYKYGQIYIYISETSSNPQSKTIETERPPHDRPGTCLIAHHYSSPTFVALRFHFRKGTFNTCLQNVISFSFFFFFLNCSNLKFHKPRGVFNLKQIHFSAAFVSVWHSTGLQ